MNIGPIFIYVLLVIIVGLLALVLNRLLKGSSPEAVTADRLKTAEADLAAVREAKTEAERQLAAEATTAARVPGLEQELATLREARGNAEKSLSTAEEGLAQTEKALQQSQERIASLEKEVESLSPLKASLSEANALLKEKTESLATQKEELDATKAALSTAQKDGEENAKRLATAEEKLRQELKQAGEKLALLTEAKASMTVEFKALADSIMVSHGETFTKQNKEQVEGILKPLREKLFEFQQGLQTAHTESIKERATLAEQIRSLTETSAKMTSETQNLTRALKGKAQTQGAWGEMILSTILEKSGLREGEEYTKQTSHTGEDGARLRPDVIVNLPGGQKVVIDSKVSLKAFEEYVNAPSDADRAAALTRHIVSVRVHIKELSAKDYHAAVGSDLDYVVMFVPIEGALAAALQEEPNLTSLAAEANVAIATPTTLMIALRTIANVWQVERRNRNAEEIASRAGKIYDKFVGFLGDMDDLGGRIDKAKESFQDAMGKLSSGRGNIIRQVEQLKGLGAKTSKSIPGALLDDDTPEALPAPESVASLPEGVGAIMAELESQ